MSFSVLVGKYLNRLLRSSMKVNFQIFLFLMVKKSVFCKNKRLMVDAFIFKLISIQVLPFLVLTLSNLSEFFERAVQVLVVMLLQWQPFINCKLKEILS